MLLEKLRVDLKYDPDTIEYMIGNKERAKLTEEEEISLKNRSTKRFWLSFATKLVMSRSQVSACVKQITKDPRTRRRKYVDRLKNDKKYLREEIKIFCNAISQAKSTFFTFLRKILQYFFYFDFYPEN